MEPLVSILIPAYNSEQWLAQTSKCKEVVVVDDGSTNGTLPIAKRFVRATDAP